MEHQKTLNIDKIVKLVGTKGTMKVGELVEETNGCVKMILSLLAILEESGDIRYIYKDDNDILNSELELTKSHLDLHNQALHEKTIFTREIVRKDRETRGFINMMSYSIIELKNRFFEFLKSFDGVNEIDDIELSFVDKSKFDGDICIKIPSLLQLYKGAGYIKEIVPLIVKQLLESELYKNGVIKSVEQKGIYINISLGDDYLYKTLVDVISKADRFGEIDNNKGESIVVDYSSPNTAKHLHAGHIRSTIIGHVLSNLYDASGYCVHRVNHINDWGGFGYLIEGYLKWKDLIPHFKNENDMLFFIYKTYRLGERASSSKEEYESLDEELLIELKKYYGDFNSYEGFQVLFTDFLSASKEKFSNLENGKKEEVELWSQMVKWSINDFERFYNVLGIHQDYIIGESFYAPMGRNLVSDFEKEGKIVFYTKDLAEKDIKKLKLELDSGKIKEKEFKKIEEEIIRDIGSYVVLFPNFERFVVLKGDESTIYATRDLAAITYRNKVFQPYRIVYEVGQEQEEHFDKLFKSAKEIGVDGVDFTHVYHGFYVNAETGKKLSSRDGASNVLKLIEMSIDYFRNKYAVDNKGFSPEEIEDISHKLAIGSIIFNDIRKDKKASVAISNDIEETCKSFEDSGGAYIVYSICRANSILKKSGVNNFSENDFEIEKLEGIEKEIINEISRFPLVVLRASQTDSPSVLTEYLLNLSRIYNSYYNNYYVLDGENSYRLLITKSVSQVLKNGMRLCNINVPDSI